MDQLYSIYDNIYLIIHKYKVMDQLYSIYDNIYLIIHKYKVWINYIEFMIIFI